VNVWAVVVAAGAGKRLGSETPKAFVELAGRPLLEWSLEAIDTSSVVSGIVLVVPPSILEHVQSPAGGPRVVVAGGRTRQESVVAGIAQIPADADVIVVHDAARPLAEPALFRQVVEALGAAETEGIVPVVPSPDTIKRVVGGRVQETVDRGEIGLAQTPQAFVASALLEAHARARAEAMVGTDDAKLLEAFGFRVGAVEGDPENFKITTPRDLERAQDVLNRRLGARPGGGQ
jgi:2-C-methyl-D-erythritol 4-phosphate cytidylyltransferase / 2-C-methyl-D-erythritol 2,4-cyclodiphosphate synthase